MNENSNTTEKGDVIYKKIDKRISKRKNNVINFDFTMKKIESNGKINSLDSQQQGIQR